jgi:hypothetical protein
MGMHMGRWRGDRGGRGRHGMEADYVRCDWKPRGGEQSRRGENFSQSPTEEVSINNLWSATIAT